MTKRCLGDGEKAAFKRDLYFNCRLSETKDVVRVEWWKHSLHEDTSLASYNKESGKTVKHDLEDKVDLIEDSLQNSSIILKNVTLKDEGCYQCQYETSSKERFKKDACLRFSELHEPVLHVEGSPEEAVKMSVLLKHVQLLCNSSFNNTNMTALLPGSRERFKWCLPVFAAIAAVIALVCVCAAAVLRIKWWRKQNCGNRDPENDGTPQNSAPPTRRIKMLKPRASTSQCLKLLFKPK